MAEEVNELADIKFDPTLMAAPPRRRRTKKDTPPSVDTSASIPYQPADPIVQGRRGKDIVTIERGLTQTFVFIGMGLSMVNLYDGMVIGENAGFLAERWTKLAEKNPTVKKWLLLFLEGGDWAAAIVGTMAVALPIAANHLPDRVPVEMVGMVTTIGVTLPIGMEPGMSMEDVMNQTVNENGSS
jgi:hypothetical protein